MDNDHKEVSLENLVNTIQDIVIAVEKNGSIIYMNKSFLSLFGSTLPSDRKANLCDLFEPTKRDFLLQKINESIELRKGINTALEYKKRWFNLSINPYLAENNECSCVIIIAYDFTETMEKQMELNNLAEELEISRDAFQDNAGELARAYDELEYSRQELERFSKKLEEQNKMLQESEETQKLLNAQKDKFVSIISHDLRAPFTSILGYSEALTNAWETISEEEKLEFINIINKSTKNQLELLDTLLQWSRLETNKVHARPEVVNMANLLENCSMILSGIAQKKNIEIEQSIPENIGVLGDHLLLSQVIQNLISNALKFTKSQGKITVSYDGEFDELMLKFFVKDTGIGMPESMRTKLFRIDSKVSRKGTSGEAGTGLGLLVCKEIIELHNGIIWVESTEDVGTTFYFTLPKAFPNILFISDSLDDYEYFKNILNEYNIDFNIILKRDINETKDLLENPKFSLIIYDRKTNHTEKDPFFDLITENEKFKIIPNILVTHDTSPEAIESYSASGINFILTKPFEENIVVDVLTKILLGLLNQP